MSDLPSIRNRALMCTVTFTKPKMTRLDRKATQDAERANGAHDAGKYVKDLYPKDKLKPIVAVENQARNVLRRYGVEWGGTGMWLIPMKHFMDATNEVEALIDQRRDMVRQLAQDVVTLLREAESLQGDLFDESQYPNEEHFIYSFGADFRAYPVGNIGGGMFDALEEDLAGEVQSRVEASTRHALKDAMTEPLERLMDAVINIYDKTSRDDSKIYTTLMGDLEEITSLMPDMNVLDVPQVNQLAAYCRERMLVPVESIKDKDSGKRKAVASTAEALIHKAGIKPASVQNSSPAERKEAAQEAAANIIDQMGGLF